MQRIFADRHKTGQLDLEAAEMAIRSTVHQTGADAVSELLRFAPPDEDQRSLACTCGHVARYEGMRSRPILTVVGWARIDRPYYLCPACHTGHFLPMLSWTSLRQTSRRECGACWRRSAAWRPSPKAATKSSSWRV